MKEALSYMDRCPIMGCVFDEIAQRIGFADARLEKLPRDSWPGCVSRLKQSCQMPAYQA